MLTRIFCVATLSFALGCSSAQVAATDASAPGDATAPDDASADGTADTSNLADGSPADGGVSDGSPADGDGDGGCGWTDAGPSTGVAACTSSLKAQRAAAALQAPILPLVGAGGLRFGPPGTPLTLTSAEQSLCPGDFQGDLFGDGKGVMTWGDNAELWAHFDCSLAITFFVLYQGNNSVLTFKSADMSHTYDVRVLSQMQKDGAGYTLDWNDAVKLDAEMNELYDALRATYASQLPPLTGSCSATTPKSCTTSTFGDVGYIYFPKLGTAIWVANVNAGQPTSSIPNRIDIDYVP